MNRTMTQEDKNLLLKDLCGRFPYGVLCRLSNKGANVSIIEKLGLGGLDHFISGTMDVKPYLRPMSSMTEEELLILKEWIFIATDTKGKIYFDGFRYISAEDTIKAIDYIISHHFDYRGLIEKGLALEAPEGMYKTE